MRTRAAIAVNPREMDRSHGKSEVDLRFLLRPVQAKGAAIAEGLAELEEAAAEETATEREDRIAWEVELAYVARWYCHYCDEGGKRYCPYHTH